MTRSRATAKAKRDLSANPAASASLPRLVDLGLGSPAPLEQSLYELLFHEANDALLLVDTDRWTIASANKRMMELTGYLRHELEGQAVSILFPEKNEPSANVVSFRSMALQESTLKMSGFYEDMTLRKKDGYLAYITLSVRTLSTDETRGRPLTVCILRDTLAKRLMERDLITKHTELRNAYGDLERAHIELKAAQEALVQAGKLAALGELSAGVAHELNQPLTGIMGFSQELEVLVRENWPETMAAKTRADALDFCREIHRNSVRMSKIVKELREFTRKSTEDYQFSSVEKIASEALRLLDAQFKSRGIGVEIVTSENVPEIYCNPFKIEQVFINLATNARDAIAEKGAGQGSFKIRINWPAPVRNQAGEKNDERFVEVVVSDDGCGMNELTKGRAFDPFFTTKEVGSGTGLGLSLSYGILQQIHATMVIESTMGKGSTFYLRLPIDYRNLTTSERERDHGPNTDR